MKLSQLASKPQLIKLVIDDEATVKEHGEAIEFWTWDRQPLDVFMKLSGSNAQDHAAIIDTVRTLILDEKGKQIIMGEAMLPTNLLIAAINKITEILGK
jgi:hypothetical protein